MIEYTKVQQTETNRTIDEYRIGLEQLTMTRAGQASALGRYTIARWSSQANLLPAFGVVQRGAGPLLSTELGFLSVVSDGIFSQGEGPAEQVAEYVSQYPETIRAVTLPFQAGLVTWCAPLMSTTPEREQFTELTIVNGSTLNNDLIMQLLQRTASPAIKQSAFLNPASIGLGVQPYMME